MFPTLKIGPWEHRPHLLEEIVEQLTEVVMWKSGRKIIKKQQKYHNWDFMLETHLVRVILTALKIYDWAQGMKREDQRTSAGSLGNSHIWEMGKGIKKKKMKKRIRSSG